MHSSVRLSWRSSDQYRGLTRVALGGAAVAAAMALWGLPPLDLHGPLHRLGIMDPLCGGTRAAYFAVTARWALAWYYNPLGPVAVVAAGLMVLRAAVGHLSGHWLGVQVTLSRRVARGLYVSSCVALLALGVRQQVIAGALR